ncbi:MAG: polysaccharide export protein [Myxococcales bacterium]|nr:polysaccharide export protein [Myxococcales bacterium]
MIRYVALILCVVACSSPYINYPYKDEPDPRNKELVLGVGDVVGINVWEQKGLDADPTIRPDGTITMPLVGDLKAAGMTPSALKEKIKAALASFVKIQGTEVTVAVRKWSSCRFQVDGEVTKGGVFMSDQYVTVSEALGMAGGLSRFAKRHDIKLIRKDDKGNERQIPLDYDQLMSGQRPDMNIFVLCGDRIWVP